MNKFATRDERIAALLHLYPTINQKFLLWLQEHSYFIAPASSKYHGAYDGGLFDHSYTVAKVLVDLTNNNKLHWKRSESPVIIGLFHDICKIDQYKHEIVDGYIQTAITFNNETLYKGNGDKSIMILASHIQLTDEEVACIRYHMGAFTEKEEWEYYTRACKRYENVLWTHHADMFASQVMNL